MKTMETGRLTLRTWQLDDLNDLHEYAKDPQVGPMAGWKPHSSKYVRRTKQWHIPKMVRYGWVWYEHGCVKMYQKT